MALKVNTYLTESLQRTQIFRKEIELQELTKIKSALD